ncbi:MAG: ribonucleoside triphosphate reductase [Patescibacteria group bacterium]
MPKLLSLFKKAKKRDGRIVPFRREKITNALFKAGRATGEFGIKEAKRLTKIALLQLKKKVDGEIPSVEQIQDAVEDMLLTTKWLKTAKAYILYRDLHNKIRNINSVVIAEDLLGDYLEKKDWRVKENSNMAYSLQGLNNHVASAISAGYWLNKIYPEPIREAHINGDIHVHDLQLLGPYCVGWDLQDLLRRGFGGVAGKVECRAPKHFGAALGQIVNFFYTLQGESAGAQAFSSFDTLLAPFISFDKLTQKEVKQNLQEFVFNMNIPTRVGFQTPFTNITLDLHAPKTLGEEAVIIGGKPQTVKYNEFQKEMDMFNRALAEVMMEGDANGRVFTFPIPTYNITRDFDWENPVLEPLWEMTAKYGIPYFSNFVNSDMNPEDARSMCCRLRLDNRELRKRGGGFFGANPLTGSIGVVTINLPRIGYLSKSKKEYKERLMKLMDLAKESLEIKRRIIEKFTDEGLYPYSRHYLQTVKDRFGQYWKNHFGTIGINGMNESLVNFMGVNITDPKGHQFAEDILDMMREHIGSYQQETNNLYNLEATPAEGTAYRLAKADKKRYPEIKVANEEAYHNSGAAPYYTNSSHLPVGHTEDPFTALDLQDSLQTKYTGGTVFHTFLGERMPDTQATKRLVRKIAENYHLPYYTLTPTFSVCPQDGYLSGEHFACPKCGQPSEVYSRIVGYLRPVQQWNDGKRSEFADRLEYKH